MNLEWGADEQMCLASWTVNGHEHTAFRERVNTRIHRATTATVARHEHGTALSGFLPRGWDHLVASDGTAQRVAP
jgi:hypothetical protein